MNLSQVPNTQPHLGTIVVTGDHSLTLAHREHGECYHSRDGARFEAENLYVGGSQLVNALTSPVEVDRELPLRVLDVGLGLGFNALATIDAWSGANAARDLEVISLEIDSDLVGSLASGTAPWQLGWPVRWTAWSAGLGRIDPQQSLKPLSYSTEIHHATSTNRRCRWTVLVGDARSTFTEWLSRGTYSFIWQDAFSPATCPELWTSEWFSRLAAASRPGTTLMTYSAARLVRDNLSATGWTCERFPSGGTKRHWLRARRLALDAEPGSVEH